MGYRNFRLKKGYEEKINWLFHNGNYLSVSDLIRTAIDEKYEREMEKDGK